MYVNQLTISGNLTRDPEVRSLLSGQALCNIRIAHNERRKTSSGEWGDRPDYFDVAIWSGLGEWIANNLTKGGKVVIAVRLKWRQHDASDGTKRQAVDITAHSVIPVPGPRSTPTAEAIAAGHDDFTTDDDIPF